MKGGVLIVVYAAMEQPSRITIHLIKQGEAKTASQVYSLGLKIYELALQSLTTIEQNFLNKTNVKMVQAYIRNLATEKQDLISNYNMALNNEISFFYQNKGLSLNEVGQINEDELEEIIYPILNSYSRKLHQLEELVSLMDIYNQNEVLMIYLEITDNLYSVFRQLSHLYPIVELRPFFKEMTENVSKLYC